MKTSLLIEDSLFEAARKEAQKERKTLSEVITSWARLGYQSFKEAKKSKKSGGVKTVNLGGAAQIDINSRRDWLDLLNR